jgi:hypothetical protein
MCDPFGWHRLNSVDLCAIKEKLSHFETMTWNEILVRGRKQNHYVSRDDLSADAENRLVKLRQDDIDSLLSLHLGGKERVWGMMEGGVLRLLWWDPSHKVCPSLKKHT